MQPRFLLIDDNRDGRSVIARAVQRKYRDAALHDFMMFSAAVPRLAAMEAEPKHWIVLADRTTEHATTDLVAAIRTAHPRVPSLRLGGRDEAPATLAAGVTHFLAYAAWLLLAGLVERVNAVWLATPHAQVS